MLRTPFHAEHVAAGARMVEFAGFEMPIQYSGILEEHRRVREAVGLFDVSHMGEVLVRGPKAVEALEWLVSNEVASIAIGQARYAVLCNERGGVVDDVVIYRLGEQELLVCTNAANQAKDYAWMVEHNPFPGQATFTDEGEGWAQLAVQGPNAAAVLSTLTDVDLQAIGPFRFCRGAVAGVEGCLISRTGYTGEDGFEVFAPAQRAGPLWQALLHAGQDHGILPVGLGARDTLRLEARLCLYGHELSEDLSPLQARLGWVTRLDKPGGFLGRDALVARKDQDTHFLAGFVCEGKRIPREGMTVLRDGVEIGYVTSGTRSPSSGRGIGLAYLRRPNGRPGTRLTIDVRGRQEPAVVVKGPLHLADPSAHD